MLRIAHDDMVAKIAELMSDVITHTNKPTGLRQDLKELRHDILSHFFDGLNYCSSVSKPKNNGLLGKKNTKGVMAEDGEE